jgi:hypothetical protein
MGGRNVSNGQGIDRGNTPGTEDIYDKFFDARSKDLPEGAVYSKPSLLREAWNYVRDFFTHLGDGIASAWSAVLRNFASEDQAKAGTRNIRHPIVPDVPRMSGPPSDPVPGTTSATCVASSIPPGVVSAEESTSASSVPQRTDVHVEGETQKPTDADESAFDAYMSLCKKDDYEPGSMVCPQNFKDAAVRHATSLLKLVEQRREQALRNGQEFWLPTEDQERHKAAAGLLALQKESNLKKAGEQALQLEPIQTHSSQQITSFMTWRDAKNDLPKLSADPAFSLDAALAYAGQLLSEHAGKAQATQDPLKTMLQDAMQLIAEFDKYKKNISIQEDAADILSQLNELKEPSMFPVLATGKPPPPPPPRIRKVGIVPGQSPSGGSDLRPPAPPASRIPTNKPLTLARANKVPELSTFDTDYQVEAYSLLNKFLREYEDQQSQGDIKFERNSVYFSAHVVAAAADFLERVAGGAEGNVKPTDMRNSAAATYLVMSYGDLHSPKT